MKLSVVMNNWFHCLFLYSGDTLLFIFCRIFNDENLGPSEVKVVKYNGEGGGQASYQNRGVLS